MFEEQNPYLAEKLAHLLADAVTAKFIFHGYHWNVMGDDFGQYHKFFETLYEDVDGSIDDTAEQILKAGYPAPYMLSDYSEMTCIKEERQSGASSHFLLESARRVNTSLLVCLYETFEVAEKCNEQGLLDFIAGRIDMHKKWNWQIKAFLGVR
jgi:starvation-inducible DNA-binding protein